MDKSTLCYCIPNLQKLVHQVPLCGRYLLVYNIITTSRSYQYQQYILFSAFFTLQLVSLNSQLRERRAFPFCRAVGGIDFFKLLQHGCSQNLEVFSFSPEHLHTQGDISEEKKRVTADAAIRTRVSRLLGQIPWFGCGPVRMFIKVRNLFCSNTPHLKTVVKDYAWRKVCLKFVRR